MDDELLKGSVWRGQIVKVGPAKYINDSSYKKNSSTVHPCADRFGLSRRRVPSFFVYFLDATLFYKPKGL